MTRLIKAELGDRVIFSCFASRHQAITFTWMKDGIALASSKLVKVLDNTIVVSRVATNNYGTYTCNVTDGKQNASYSMELERFAKVTSTERNYGTQARKHGKNGHDTHELISINEV